VVIQQSPLRAPIYINHERNDGGNVIGVAAAAAHNGITLTVMKVDDEDNATPSRF
jgi:hypothetical protein